MSPEDRAQAFALTPVSRETEARLETLVAVLTRWQKAKNLVGPSTLEHVWTRHIADSLQLVPLGGGARRWLDLGSGGGFPGLVIAAALADEPDAEVTLVESNGRKCAFLREAARAMGTRATVRQARIEDVIEGFAGRIEAVTARALAPLPTLIGWTHKLLKTGAIGLFPKGREAEAELTETAKSWKVELTIHNSLTDPAGRILRVTAASPRETRPAPGSRPDRGDAS